MDHICYTPYSLATKLDDCPNLEIGDCLACRTAYETLQTWMRWLDHWNPVVGPEFIERHGFFAKLMGIPTQALRLEKVHGDELFHHWGLCRLLLETSEGMRSENTAYSLDLAELADAVAGQLDGGLDGLAWVADLRALAAASLGDACRARGQLRSAQEHLQRARTLLASGTGRVHIMACVNHFESLLRPHHGQLTEASPLLFQAPRPRLAVRR